MKNMLLMMLAVSGLSLGSAVLAETKIGVVDSNKIFTESPQIKAAKTDFKKKFEGREKEFTEAQKAFQSDIEKFSKDSTTMTEKDKKAAQQKIMDQQKRLQEMQAKLQNDATKAHDDIIKDFTKKMEDAVAKVSKEKSFDIVAHKAGLAYNKPELDVTDEVLKQLKK